MRRLPSILFLFLLLLLHYSRVLNYLQCQAVAALTTQASVRCDCEKQVAEKPMGSGQTASGNPFSKLRPEEVFAAASLPALSWYLASSVLKTGQGPGQSVPCGYSAAIFQPPRS